MFQIKARAAAEIFRAIDEGRASRITSACFVDHGDVDTTIDFYQVGTDVVRCEQDLSGTDRRLDQLTGDYLCLFRARYRL